MSISLQFLPSINQQDADDWNALAAGNPFLKHEFLAALEHTGCTNAASGWIPQHLCLYQNSKLIGFLPLYEKHHSYGEYVFDWSWADAYQQHGYRYYPKLVSAIPYTPTTGPRLCLQGDYQLTDVLPLIIAALQEHCEKKNYSSWHCLFPTAEESQQWLIHNMAQRQGTQFHWHNRNYRDFSDFLSTFNSRKRKNLKKERRRVTEQAVQLSILEGKEISEEYWQLFYQFYHLTYLKRSGRQGYLTKEFFLEIGATMPNQIVMICAHRESRLVAAALCFKDQESLYGRYWGCREEFECLHFEACYYQGIEYAIEQKLQRFDPGAQGEHKIQRGFEPTTTYSNHYLVHPDFRDAVNRFLKQERLHNQHYREAAANYLPYRANTKHSD